MGAVCGKNLVCIVLHFFSCSLENYLFSLGLLHHNCVNFGSLCVGIVNGLLCFCVCFGKILLAELLLLCRKSVCVLDSLFSLFLSVFSYLFGIFLSLVYYSYTLLFRNEQSISQSVLILTVLSYLFRKNLQLLFELLVFILQLLVFNRYVL